ncbi:MAG: hypothetical protein P4L84_16875 [Isosphaeraceae bacterium]|nr:hypothetical protein [Isosphaeraceae bacterium]
MRQSRFLHGGLLFVLAASAGLAGCTHNYYYGGVPQCAPGTPGAVQYGSSCEVPAASGGAALVQNGTRSSAVGPTPRVVVSEPSGPRLSWRRSDPEAGVATTRVTGGITDDSTTTR